MTNVLIVSRFGLKRLLNALNVNVDWISRMCRALQSMGVPLGVPFLQRVVLCFVFAEMKITVWKQATPPSGALRLSNTNASLETDWGTAVGNGTYPGGFP